MALIHGETRRRAVTPEYCAWQRMRRRCFTSTDPKYPIYGGRGISVCERWSTFQPFLEDMGRRPGRGYSLDRIDVNGNYEPGNCRWATAKQQAINRRCVIHVEAFGEKLLLAEWAERLGCSEATVRWRLQQRHDSPESAVSRPVQDRGRKITPDIAVRIRARAAAGEMQKAIAADLGLNPITVGDVVRGTTHAR